MVLGIDNGLLRKRGTNTCSSTASWGIECQRDCFERMACFLPVDIWSMYWLIAGGCWCNIAILSWWYSPGIDPRMVSPELQARSMLPQHWICEDILCMWLVVSCNVLKSFFPLLVLMKVTTRIHKQRLTMIHWDRNSNSVSFLNQDWWLLRDCESRDCTAPGRWQGQPSLLKPHALW